MPSKKRPNGSVRQRLKREAEAAAQRPAGYDTRVRAALQRARRTTKGVDGGAVAARMVALLEALAWEAALDPGLAPSPRREQAARAGFENLIEAEIEERHAELGTMTCRLRHDLRLETPLAEKHPGDMVTLALRAGDIMVATELPKGLSARNIVPGVVEAAEDRAGMVELMVRCGETTLKVHVTRGARLSLTLEAGRAVWLVIKTQSIRYLRG